MKEKEEITLYTHNPTFHKLANMISEIDYNRILSRSDILWAVEYGFLLANTKQVQNLEEQEK